MKNYTLVAPCFFGVEKMLAREIKNLGYEIIKTEDGRVTYKDVYKRQVCIRPDVLELIVFKILISKIVPKVIGTTSDSLPISVALWLPNITARAAIEAGKNKTHCIQPVKTPNFLP